MGGLPPASLLRGVHEHHTDHHADVVNDTDTVVNNDGNVVNNDGNVVNHTDREHHDGHPDPEVRRLTGSPFFPKPPTACPVAV